MTKLQHIDNPIQFYTATILNWKMLLNQVKYKQIIIDSLSFLSKEKRVKIYGFVIMDNHIHIIWQGTTLHSLKHTQLSFMKYTAQQIKFDLIKYNPDLLPYFMVEAKDRNYQFWERNSLSVDIMSSEVFIQKLNYIHNNPVKAGLCNNRIDYKYSSVKHYAGISYEFDFIEVYNEHL